MILSTSNRTLCTLKVVGTWPGLTVTEIYQETALEEENIQTTINHLETLLYSKLIERRDDRYFPGEALAALYHSALSEMAKKLDKEARKISKYMTGENVNGD